MRRYLLRAAVVLGGLVLVTAPALGHGGHCGGGGHGYGGYGCGGYAPCFPSAFCPDLCPIVPTQEVADSAVAPATWYTCRYLRIKNGTDKKITLYLQYRTWTNKQRYLWYPADPALSDEVLAFEMEPGAETDLAHDGWRINASRVRLWAEAASGEEWMEYRDQDLWLVDADTAGQRSYYADEMETFPFTIEG